MPERSVRTCVVQLGLHAQHCDSVLRQHCERPEQLVRALPLPHDARGGPDAATPPCSGSLGNVCSISNGIAGCSSGSCTIASCNVGYSLSNTNYLFGLLGSYQSCTAVNTASDVNNWCVRSPSPSSPLSSGPDSPLPAAARSARSVRSPTAPAPVRPAPARRRAATRASTSSAASASRSTSRPTSTTAAASATSAPSRTASASARRARARSRRATAGTP